MFCPRELRLRQQKCAKVSSATNHPHHTAVVQNVRERSGVMTWVLLNVERNTNLSNCPHAAWSNELQIVVNNQEPEESMRCSVNSGGKFVSLIISDHFGTLMQLCAALKL